MACESDLGTSNKSPHLVNCDSFFSMVKFGLMHIQVPIRTITLPCHKEISAVCWNNNAPSAVNFLFSHGAVGHALRGWAVLQPCADVVYFLCGCLCLR